MKAIFFPLKRIAFVLTWNCGVLKLLTIPVVIRNRLIDILEKQCLTLNLEHHGSQNSTLTGENNTQYPSAWVTLNKYIGHRYLQSAYRWDTFVTVKQFPSPFLKWWIAFEDQSSRSIMKMEKQQFFSQLLQLWNKSVTNMEWMSLLGWEACKIQSLPLRKSFRVLRK